MVGKATFGIATKQAKQQSDYVQDLGDTSGLEWRKDDNRVVPSESETVGDARSDLHSGGTKERMKSLLRRGD